MTTFTDMKLQPRKKFGKSLFFLTAILLVSSLLASTAVAEEDDWSVGVSLGLKVAGRGFREAAPERERTRWYISTSFGGGLMNPILNLENNAVVTPGFGPFATLGLEFGVALTPSFYLRPQINGNFALGNIVYEKDEKKYFDFGGDILFLPEYVSRKNFTIGVGPGISFGLSSFSPLPGTRTSLFSGAYIGIKGVIEVGHLSHDLNTWNGGIRVGYAFEYMFNLQSKSRETAIAQFVYAKMNFSWWM